MITTDLSVDKEKIVAIVDQLDSELRELALRIHSNPELAFYEFKASEWLSEKLEEEGFIVERGVAGLQTAFIATWEGSAGGPTIGILAEYDALPGLGHACGHNIIGTSAIGAALALKGAFPELPGKIKVIGTPAEEDGGGKVIMCEKGIFDDLDAAMMTHPSRKTMVVRGALACVTSIFKFYGKESHAAGSPEKGISALEALLNSYNTINSLRQFFTDDVRIHGIITNGGQAANIVPGYCEAKFMIRASTRSELEGVKEKVYRAVRNSSEAVGATCEIIEGVTYAERNNNVALANLYKANLLSMGVEVNDPPKKGGVGSSDIGNVGQVTATIHPYIRIGEGGGHTPEFAEDSKSELGMLGLNHAAKAMAMTTYELCMKPEALKRVRIEFEEWKKISEE
ncbi:M20 family metallopeptidase [Robertmurraya massiliosenegalensis]|uniref:M20 family metallopeptidase n=1 Tax=Robertmurraya TaxID=2837507 RepID=UPI0039A67B25